jgi:small subunit ribosomal protein S17
MTSVLDARSQRRMKKGTVISDKMNKTVVVMVKRTIRHPKYNKITSRSKKYYAHDEAGTHKVGDTVTIMETRPISKIKRWRIVEES